jgi:flavorubredoxin
MSDAGFDIIGEGCLVQWNPDDDAKQEAFEFGKQIAKS